MLGAPFRLRCEYLSNPLGIDATRPRLSWWVDDDRPAEIQTGYHVLAASNAELLADDSGDLWDTGRVESQQTLNIEYRGSPLSSSQRVWWKVRSFDSDGLPSGWSEPAFFELGLLSVDDWRARWVATPLRGSPATPVQVPALRRSFELPDDVVEARLHITAFGAYRVELNGQQITQDRLTPGWTDYRKRVRYQTYDVTRMLRKGDNAVAALLGDGWYCGHPGIGQRQQFGERPILCAQINVTLASGALLLICTDHQWKWQRSGLLSADLVLGESVDARQHLAGWSDRGYDEAGWYPVAVEEAPAVPRTATMSPPIRAHRELPAVALPVRYDDASGDAASLGPPRWIFDFGETLLGCARVRLPAPVVAGVQLRIRYARGLDRSGEALVGVDLGVDWYTTAGHAEETFEAQFSLHGFRYVEVAAELAQAPEVTAMAIGAELQATGTFSCDHRVLNELFAVIQRNQRARALDIPLAGIGSERRLGLTGETRGAFGIGSFNHDVAAFYAKWIDDLADAQQVGGGFPPVVPEPVGVEALRVDGGPGWSDALVSAAWAEYRYFGNRRALERHYSSIRTYLRGLTESWPDHVRGHQPNPLAPDGDATPGDLSGTALFFHTARLAARIAGVLGNLGDLEDFEELAQSVRSAFRKRFVTNDGRLVGDTDGGYVLALHLGLLDRAEQRAAFETIVRRMEYRGAGTVDLLSTPYLLQVLTRGGRVDLAYEALMLPEAAGPLTDVDIWNDAGAGIGRVALAAVAEWLYTGLAGIDLDNDLSDSHNAFRRVRVQPRPPLGAEFALNTFGPPIRSVSAGIDTVNGHFESSWQITDTAFELEVLVPCNCSAVVVMPDDSEHSVAAGRHRFEMPFVDASDGIPILREVSEAS
ncbi:MAG: glycoside hydrolase family 78 protein, partial [Gammaproteobacteria bacterium]|nr:glycoside hydrolase family 78 protein [Gammaproteobacteria bacterium]